MILPGTRWLLVAFGGLTFLAFLALFVMAAHTDRYFAWTIAPPATAAFLGAAYAAGCAGMLLGLRSARWASIRVPYVGIFVFTVVTLAATLLHLDRFHFGAPGALARFAAWLWLAVYVVIPVAMLVMLVRQERRADVRTRSRPSPLVRVLAAAQGAVLMAVGLALFAAPELARLLWPWPLTPLTARMVAAWLIGFGVALALGVRRAHPVEDRTAAGAYLVLAVLELVVVLRYAGTVRWDFLAAWVYLAVAASILALALRALTRPSAP